MKGFIGSANIDTNSRLCMSSSVAGHVRAFGSDTVPGNYEDLELADLVVLVGTNLAWCHPVLFQRIQAARSKRPDMRVVLIDPRRTMTSDIADIHLPIAPDGDLALFSGLLARLARSDRLDRDYIERHTTGFAAALGKANAVAREDIAQATGLSPERIDEFYTLFAETEKVVTVYSQGVNQSSIGTDKVNAIINCHLATGRIGRPGMGPFSVTGQPNAMGGREVGGLASTLAAHMEIEDSRHRDTVQRFWRSPSIPDRPGLKAVDLFQAVARGDVKALWIMATNPVDSMPDADAVRAALEACPFVVVSDITAETDTIPYADVKLPAAGWGEKDGTVTNSERRISRQRAFLPVPGEARPDWWQMAEIGRRMGFESAFSWSGPAEIFAEYAALTAFENNGDRDLDIGAHATITPAKYDALSPFQWPQPTGVTPISTRFFANGGYFTPDRKARFVAIEAIVPQRAGGAFPLVLNTGRVRDHWHTMTRTGKSRRLSAHIGEPFGEFHPADAAALNIGDAELAEIESPHGRILVRALVTARQRQGSVFVPMHWNDRYASQCTGRQRWSRRSTDPRLRAAGLEACRRERKPVRAVSVFGFAVSAVKPDASSCDYWAIARADGGWKIEFALGADLADIGILRPANTSVFLMRTLLKLIAYGDTASGEQRVRGIRRIASRRRDSSWRPSRSACRGTGRRACFRPIMPTGSPAGASSPGVRARTCQTRARSSAHASAWERRKSQPPSGQGCGSRRSGRQGDLRRHQLRLLQIRNQGDHR